MRPRAPLALVLAVAACGTPTAPAPSEPTAIETEPAAAEPAEPAAAEAPDPESPDAEPPPGPASAGEPAASQDSPSWPATPPWAATPVPIADVPRVYRTEHRKAENRATCPLLILTDLGEGAGAKPRRANFHGGWAVAYDKKGLPGTLPSGDDCDTCGRGAFGIAGVGITKGGPGPSWPDQVAWSDGSHVGYGPEGLDPNARRSLAFVEAADAECPYNVWSALGQEHLVVLLRGLRRVAK